jgi:hypothetical protein
MRVKTAIKKEIKSFHVSQQVVLGGFMKIWSNFEYENILIQKRMKL